MKNLTKILLAASAFVAAASCGDNLKAPDAAPPKDMAEIDAPNFPAAPTIGTQIDRMGRPAVNTALVALLEANATLKTTKKDNYNKASAQDSWAMVQLDPNMAMNSIRREFANHLALFDVIDQGLGTIPTPPAAGCGNGALYAGPASTMSYIALASVLADDELYVDSTKGTCNFYLSLEVEVAASVPHSQCGGRTLVHDVVDTSYSLLAAGTKGFDTANSFAPRIGDGVSAHTDVNGDTFPFLGAPH